MSKISPFLSHLVSVASCCLDSISCLTLYILVGHSSANYVSSIISKAKFWTFSSLPPVQEQLTGTNSRVIPSPLSTWRVPVRNGRAKIGVIASFYARTINFKPTRLRPMTVSSEPPRSMRGSKYNVFQKRAKIIDLFHVGLEGPLEAIFDKRKRNVIRFSGVYSSVI